MEEKIILLKNILKVIKLKCILYVKKIQVWLLRKTLDFFIYLSNSIKW